jgi:hypothetical protein
MFVGPLSKLETPNQVLSYDSPQMMHIAFCLSRDFPFQGQFPLTPFSSLAGWLFSLSDSLFCFLTWLCCAFSFLRGLEVSISLSSPGV